jgi:hypothetical protein
LYCNFITFTVLLPVDAAVVVRLLLCARKHFAVRSGCLSCTVISLLALKRQSMNAINPLSTITPFFFFFAKKLLRIESVRRHNSLLFLLAKKLLRFVVLAASCLCWYQLGTDSHNNHLTL